MPNCCAFGCQNKYDKKTDRTFHHLPKGPTLRQQWIGRICQADWCLNQSSILLLRAFYCTVIHWTGDPRILCASSPQSRRCAYCLWRVRAAVLPVLL